MRWLSALLLLVATSVAAVEPHEILDDPVLEERARALSAELRCPVCRNESIDESNAGISSDLRVALRERLVAGDTDAEAMQFLVDRYGEFILLNPPVRGANYVLWLAAPLMLLFAGLVAYRTVRGRAQAKPVDDLSPEEEARLKEILGP
ncbi:MAG: cytochrome c-type biogenesis protein [Pseudomonadota bacterium]